MIGNWKISKRELYSGVEVLVIALLFYLNVLATRYSVLGLLICIVGTILIYNFLFLRKVTESYLVYLTFLTATIEVQDFVYGYDAANIGIVNNFLIFPKLNLIPIFGYNILIWFFLLLKCKSTFFCNLKKNNKTYFIYKWSWIIFISGIFATLFSMLMNDNGIIDLPWYFSKLKSEFFKIAMVFFTFQINVLLLIEYKDYFEQLKHFAKCLFVGMAIASLWSALAGFHGYYGERSDILLLSLFSFFSVLQFTFIMYEKKASRKIIFLLSGLLSLFVMFKFSSPLGGKWLLVVMVVPLVLVWRNLFIKSPWKYISIYILCFLLFFFIMNLQELVKTNTLLEYKYQQAIETISIFSPDWYENLSSSPKFRIDEFLNICIEYIKKPIFLLFGKGFAGSVTQHTSVLNWGNPGAFTVEQVEAGIYINLHESINLLFLRHGLLGIYYFIMVIWNGIKCLAKSQWIIIGLIWWVFYYGCYNTLLLGAVILVLGFFECDSHKYYKYV